MLLPHRILTHLLLFLPLCFLFGCADQPITASMNGEMATPYHVQYNAPVQTSPTQVFVQPTSAPNAPPTALFVPLRVTQDVQRPRALSQGISKQIWDVWLRQGAFKALEFYDGSVPYRVTDALGLARRKGAELLIGGYINHFIDGGPGGTSNLTLQIDIYEVATGVQLWSMAQSGTIQKIQATDLFLVGIEQRMPTDPLTVLIQELAHRMGGIVSGWIRQGSSGDPANQPPNGAGSGGVIDGKAF